MSVTKKSAIGIFDSGIGGITVLQEISRLLPGENVVYIGDEANFPYGEKNTEQIQELSLKICDWFKKHDIKLIVIACNTITAAAFEKICDYVDVDVVGVVDAGVEAILDSTHNNSVGILATKATIDSQIYQSKLKAVNSNLSITSVAAPKLVDFVERDIDMVVNNPNDHLKAAICEYCKDFKNNNCDTVVMACTHFPPLQPLLQEELGNNVSLVSPSKNTAEEVLKILTEKDLLNQGSGNYDFYTTGTNTDSLEKFWGSNGSFHLV